MVDALLAAGTIVARGGRRHRLVHGAAAPDLRRPHPGGGRVPRRGRRRPASGSAPASATSRFCLAAALVIAAVPRSGAGASSEESAVIGTTQAFALACGFLFVTLYAGNLSGLNSLLFGNFLGITTRQIVVLAVAGGGALVVLAAIARPLLFASVDPEVAQSRGVPVRALSVLFLVLLGVAAAETSQITGSLLVFALLVLPPATSQVLCRPAGRAAWRWPWSWAWP